MTLFNKISETLEGIPTIVVYQRETNFANTVGSLLDISNKPTFLPALALIIQQCGSLVERLFFVTSMLPTPPFQRSLFSTVSTSLSGPAKLFSSWKDGIWKVNTFVSATLDDRLQC